jgi:HD-GYP domain-containing protein (c-di-GMP phosphodiesterase class II)
MFEKLFQYLNFTAEELVKNAVFISTEPFNDIIKFYQRITDQLKTPNFIKDKPQSAQGYNYIVTHAKKVCFYSALIAKGLNVSVKDYYEIALAGLLHDLEKTYWPLDLLYGKKRDEITESDWKRIFEHPIATAVFVERLARRQLSQNVIDSIAQHHEDFDGKGYPKKISGQNICLGAKIIRITDSYDSITSPRSYKTNVMSREDALADIKNKANKAYDSDLIKVFEKVITSDMQQQAGLI